MLITDSLRSKELVQLIRNGGIGILPTDTLYGLVCSAADEHVVSRLYALKGRENKPGTVIAATIDQLIDLGIKPRYLKAVEQFWPGALSVVVPSYELAYIHLGKGGIAVRVPDDDNLTKLLAETGPLLTTSANLADKPPAATVAQAQQYFSNKVDFYVEGGDFTDHKPSTIIRIIDDAIEILRPGAVEISETGKIVKTP